MVVVTGKERTHPWEHSTHLLARLDSTRSCLGAFPLHLLKLSSSSSPPPPGSLLDCPTPGPLPALPPGALMDSPTSLHSFFPDTLFQAGNAYQEARLTHVALPVALAVGFFLFGLGLGAVCVLRRMQVSASPSCHLCPCKTAPLREREAPGSWPLGKPQYPCVPSIRVPGRSKGPRREGNPRTGASRSPRDSRAGREGRGARGRVLVGRLRG